MKNSLRILLVIALVVFSGAAYAATSGAGIAAVVNNEVVTITDLNARMGLIMTSSGMPNTEDVRARLRPQVLSGLVDEALRLQEAKRLKIDVTQEEIDTALNEIAKQNKFEPAQFRQMLKQSMGGTKPLEEQIRAQVSWGKVIARELRPRINITDNDRAAELAKLKAKIGKAQYEVAEIYMPVDGRNDETRVSEAANRLAVQLQQKPDAFGKIAREFSQSATASNGGLVGWVTEDQLPEAFTGVIGTMQKGQISNALKTGTGYTILQLRDVRAVDEKSLPTEDEIAQRLGMQRIDLLQRRYMQDLKAQAFIDIRI
ncbi:MAG: rotamase [Alphaproteobacteria bacterium]|nr:rotamase [Alphaproteobacteria bacterium]